MVTLYSTGCPKCKVLKKKLEDSKIEYKEETSIDVMQSLGIKQAPMLLADDWLMDFKTAFEWARENQGE